MKILKKILFGLIIFIALLLIIALFIPKTYTVSHTVTVNRPQAEVYKYLVDFNNQKEWSSWNEADPKAKLTYEGTPGTVGHKTTWDGNDDLGEGSQTITKITEDRMDVDLHFIRPMEDFQKAATIVKEIDSKSCEVTEEFYGSASYPMNIMSIIGKKVIGDAFIKNGENIKRILEKN